MYMKLSQLLLDKESYIVRQGRAYVTSQTRRTILCEKDGRTLTINFTIIPLLLLLLLLLLFSKFDTQR